MKSVVYHELLMPQGSHLFCFAKKRNPKKGDPDIRPDPRFEAKTSRGPKLAALKQRTASSSFSLQISGANTRGLFERMLDRSAMNEVKPGCERPCYAAKAHSKCFHFFV